MLALCIVAFLAGFIDAIVGGGGLIQTPAALVLLPQHPVATVIGTLKIPAFSGTSVAAYQYAKRVTLNYKMLALMACIAFTAAFCGSKLLSMVSNSFMKPLLLVVLVLVALYTYTNKKFGTHTEKQHSQKQQWWYAAIISVVIGFYDGFIGPGAGSFLVLAFISILGFDFLNASANAKFVNLSTNLGSISFFLLSGKILFSIALPMAACNMVGGWLGAKLALLKGNSFIRIFFLIVVCATILRFAYDIFFK
ncbi:TSUP family transporter [Pseudoflavitalea sp. G-6-1-2]|uniref:sulfite exporter TauE/SafE family protein n=1 Tax=Pseudoflavitalea sp. G-6-1-2 TaxID=2728841 RepID=UPI00146A6058|nr:TSUP family transporter [Pseudoflavitalea sp. G-6-1-2]NML23711.1 TSUP family transporter [Pseudoflavitalea sp. G-6-1-2]